MAEFISHSTLNLIKGLHLDILNIRRHAKKKKREGFSFTVMFQYFTLTSSFALLLFLFLLPKNSLISMSHKSLKDLEK